MRRVMDMKKWMLAIAVGAAMAATIILGGCFSCPTDPHAGTFESVNCGGNCGVVGSPTAGPTLTTTPGVGGGSISGTVTGFGSGAVSITVSGSGGAFSTPRTGDGAYTVSGVANGTYGVVVTGSGHYGYTSGVVVSGSPVTGVNITAMY
jgi:hypothetical protein